MPNAALSAAYTAHSAALQANLQRSFPRLCRSAVEDAVSYAFLVAAEQPDRFEAVLASSDGGRWLYVVAWRSIRGHCRRQHFRAEHLPIEDASPLASHPPSQEAAVQIHLELEVLIRQAASNVNSRFAEDIVRAFLDKALTGDTDTAVAQRCGVRREYINRAKRQVYAAL